MTIEETIQGNKLIAEFLKLKIDCTVFSGNVYKYTNYKIEDDYFREDQLEYHSSWDWLMPVVEKIESLWIGHSQPKVKIEGTYCQIADKGGYYAKNSELKKDNQLGGGYYPNKHTKLENTHRMIVEFIKWYNQNKE